MEIETRGRKNATDASMKSIQDKIHFFEQQKNEIAKTLPKNRQKEKNSSEKNDQDVNGDHNDPTLSKNDLNADNTNQMNIDESYSVQLYKDHNGSLGLKIAKRGDATYVIGFTSKINPGIQEGDQLLKVGLTKIDGKPLGAIAQLMRSATSPVSVTLKSTHDNSQVLSKVLSLQSAKTKIGKAFRRATAMGLVSKKLNDRRKQDQASSANNNSNKESNGVPSDLIKSKENVKDVTTNSSKGSMEPIKNIDNNDDNNNNNNDNNLNKTTINLSPATLLSTPGHQSQLSPTARSNNPFSNPLALAPVTNAAVDVSKANSKKKNNQLSAIPRSSSSSSSLSSPPSQQISIDKWPSPLNFTMKSVLSESSNQNNNNGNDKILALEAEIKKLRKLQTKALVAHDVELARYQKRLDDANEKLESVRNIHLTYKDETDKAKEEVEHAHLIAKDYEKKLRRVEKENGKLHEKLINAQQEQAHTKEEMLKLKLGYEELQQSHNQLIERLNAYVSASSSRSNLLEKSLSLSQRSNASFDSLKVSTNNNNNYHSNQVTGYHHQKGLNLSSSDLSLTERKENNGNRRHVSLLNETVKTIQYPKSPFDDDQSDLNWY